MHRFDPKLTRRRFLEGTAATAALGIGSSHSKQNGQERCGEQG